MESADFESADFDPTARSRVWYVYALLDPRPSPAVAFYIGKGVGARKTQHVLEEGDSAKNRRIREIEGENRTVETMELVSGLSEEDALRVEMQLIAAFGTEADGGVLTNVVKPTTVRHSKVDRVKSRPRAEARVQMALSLIKEEIVAMADLNPQGITNSDVANRLGLQSSHNGKQINYLSHSLLGLLMLEQRIIKSDNEARYWSPRNFVRRR
jgi:hypothetical protein